MGNLIPGNSIPGAVVRSHALGNTLQRQRPRKTGFSTTMPFMDDTDAQRGDAVGKGQEIHSSDVATEHEPTITFVAVTEDALSVLTPEQASAIAGIAGYALIVQRGAQTGKTWLLPPGATKIGRHPTNDIVLDDITVSRKHCQLELSEDGLAIADSGSTNGSYVNDRRVESTSLAPGDRLLIGKFYLVVAYGDG